MSNNAKKSVISLIGYRGTGKTSVGKILAEKLGYKFFDTDDEVEHQAGTSIANIFAEYGEELFRKLEHKTIFKLTHRENIVLSTGGGAILRRQNRFAIKSGGPVVWLTADVETILNRMQSDESSEDRRPALTNLPPKAEITKLLKKRTPQYEECATITIATESKTPSQIVDEILLELDRNNSEEIN